MTKKTRKREKAVKKLYKAVRKAVDKGVSQTVVENTVEAAIGKAAKKLPAKKSVALEDDDSDAESATSNPRAVKLKKLPGKTKPPTRTGGFGPGPRH
jgi:fatty acid-binding protein DegV